MALNKAACSTPKFKPTFAPFLPCQLTCIWQHRRLSASEITADLQEALETSTEAKTR